MTNGTSRTTGATPATWVVEAKDVVATRAALRAWADREGWALVVRQADDATETLLEPAEPPPDGAVSGAGSGLEIHRDDERLGPFQATSGARHRVRMQLETEDVASLLVDGRRVAAFTRGSTRLPARGLLRHRPDARGRLGGIMTDSLPLTLASGHLFLEIDGGQWLVDTGAPASFGARPSIRLAGQDHALQRSVGGLTAPSLSRYVSVDCAGLLGVDVLNRYDHVWDLSSGVASISTGSPDLGGEDVHLDEFQGIPVFTVQVRDRGVRVIFDTGAQVSYLPASDLPGAAARERLTDFHVSVGRYPVDLHEVDVRVGAVPFRLRVAPVEVIPGDAVRRALAAAGVEGIVGNDILARRRAGYFPRDGRLVL